jgi:hypothetical protein
VTADARNSTDARLWHRTILPGDPESVAIVASSRDRNDLIEQHFALRGRVFHLGGNPIVRELIRGGVGAAIEPMSVALRDAIYLLPFERLDPVTYLDGSPIDVYSTPRRSRASAHGTRALAAASGVYKSNLAPASSNGSAGCADGCARPRGGLDPLRSSAITAAARRSAAWVTCGARKATIRRIN